MESSQLPSEGEWADNVCLILTEVQTGAVIYLKSHSKLTAETELESKAFASESSSCVLIRLAKPVWLSKLCGRPF
jgi:hypothetical protein